MQAVLLAVGGSYYSEPECDPFSSATITAETDIRVLGYPFQIHYPNSEPFRIVSSSSEMYFTYQNNFYGS